MLRPNSSSTTATRRLHGQRMGDKLECALVYLRHLWISSDLDCPNRPLWSRWARTCSDLAACNSRIFVYMYIFQIDLYIYIISYWFLFSNLCMLKIVYAIALPWSTCYNPSLTYPFPWTLHWQAWPVVVHKDLKKPRGQVSMSLLQTFQDTFCTQRSHGAWGVLEDVDETKSEFKGCKIGERIRSYDSNNCTIDSLFFFSLENPKMDVQGPTWNSSFLAIHWWMQRYQNIVLSCTVCGCMCKFGIN